MLKWKVSSINCHTLYPPTLHVKSFQQHTKKGRERKKPTTKLLDIAVRYSLDVGTTFYGPAITLASSSSVSKCSSLLFNGDAV